MTLPMIPCAHCQQPFQRRQGAQKFCSKKCSAGYHNSRQVWSERPDRERRNAAKIARYRADPETAANKMREWRAAHPEAQKAIEQRTREKNRDVLAKRNTVWREKNREYLKLASALWSMKTYQQTPWVHIFRARMRHALKRGLQFTITPEWCSARYVGKCELTSIAFQQVTYHGGFYSPSLDRIDPKEGYTPENCRFILFAINAFKNTATDEEMYTVAKALIAKHLILLQNCAPNNPKPQNPDELLADTTS